MVGTMDRSRSYKKGIDADRSRRSRLDTNIQLRKNKREEGLQKRRAMAAVSLPAADDVPSMVNDENNNTVIDTSTTTPTPKKIYTVDDIPELYAIFMNPVAGREEILSSVTGFRKMLSVEKNPPVKEVIDSNVLTNFVQLLTHSDEKIQFEASWALTNVASTEYTRKVVEYGAVPYLVNMLLSANSDVREQAAWCLGNIAGDAPDLRDLVLESGAMDPLLRNIANPGTESLLGNAVWSLSNFCRGKPRADLHLITPALPYIAHLVNSNNKASLIDACWTLSYISDGADDRIQAVVDTGVAPALVRLLGSDSTSIVTPALRTLGNIVSGSDHHTQAVIDAGVLDYITPLLSSPKKNVKKEACWLISNIAAGNHSQITKLISRPDILSVVIQLVHSAEWDVRKEATWILSNIATGGEDAHVHALVELGSINALVEIISVADPKILLVVLDAIESILRVGCKTGRDYVGFVDECDGLDKIEMLQEHENEEVYEKAISIIEKYFGVEEGEDENLVPTVQGDTFAFGLPTTDKNTNVTAGDGSQQHQQVPLQPFNFYA